MQQQTSLVRPLCIAVLRAPEDFRNTLGDRFSAFVSRFQRLVTQSGADPFDASAAERGLLGMIDEFQLHGWLAAQTPASSPGQPIRTRGAAVRGGPPPGGEDLGSLLRRVGTELGRLGG